MGDFQFRTSPVHSGTEPALAQVRGGNPELKPVLQEISFCSEIAQNQTQSAQAMAARTDSSQYQVLPNANRTRPASGQVTSHPRLRWGLLVGAMTTLLSATPGWGLCPSQLQSTLDATLSQSPWATSQVGLLIQTQATTAAKAQTLYAHNPRQFFVPASNTKLLVTAAALTYLGPNYQVSTVVYGHPNPDGLTTLRVVGRGDPTLTSNQLQQLAHQVAAAGVTRVGLLVGDDSYFSGAAPNPTWEWDDIQSDYAPPVNSLILNQNLVEIHLQPTVVGQPLAITWGPAFTQWSTVNRTLTVAAGTEAIPLRITRNDGLPRLQASGQLPVGSAAATVAIGVPDPAEYFLQQFQQALAQVRVTVGQTRVSNWPDPDPEATRSEQVLAQITSPPLKDLIVPANQDSDNLYAEAILQQLGVAFAKGRADSSTEAGTAAVVSVLSGLGVAPTGIHLSDGSGLSRHNLVTPEALVSTLQAMAIAPDASTFLASMAVAGVSGTLQHRLTGTILQGRVRAKSGALTGQVSLSGYLDPPDYSPLVFSLLVNNTDQPASLIRDRMDQLLLQLGELSNSCQG